MSNVHFMLPVVLWQSKKCRLTLHYENGFTLTSSHLPDEAGKTHIYWHYPYEKLRTSSDDGNRLLWLDFGEDGELVSCPTPFCDDFKGCFVRGCLVILSMSSHIA